MLRGYKKKGKPAIWLQAFPDQAIKSPEHKPKPRAQRRRIAPISERNRSEKALYRKEAREFVAEAIKRGETCLVVNTISSLRYGMKYGHRISNKLNEVHHTRGRAGTLLREKKYWMPVSKQGHQWIHENMDAARKLGWLCPKGEWNRP